MMCKLYNIAPAFLSTCTKSAQILICTLDIEPIWLYFIKCLSQSGSGTGASRHCKTRDGRNRKNTEEKEHMRTMKTENSKTAEAKEQPRQITPQQISREEIRQRQRSMMNALLCCAI